MRSSNGNNPHPEDGRTPPPGSELGGFVSLSPPLTTDGEGDERGRLRFHDPRKEQCCRRARGGAVSGAPQVGVLRESSPVRSAVCAILRYINILLLKIDIPVKALSAQAFFARAQFV